MKHDRFSFWLHQTSLSEKHLAEARQAARLSKSVDSWDESEFQSFRDHLYAIYGVLQRKYLTVEQAIDALYKNTSATTESPTRSQVIWREWCKHLQQQEKV